MLDDLKFIHQRDGQDALGVAEKQWQQLKHKFDTSSLSTLHSPLTNIVLGGMGGSGWPALYMKAWAGLKVPFEVVSNYDLPEYVGPNTLFIASSYSGNTEETLSALDEAEKRGAQIAVMTAGGKLMERAKEANHPLLEIPSGIQPRMSSFYFLLAMAHLFEQLNLSRAGIVGELNEAGEWLEGTKDSWRPDVAQKDNLAKQIALELAGKTVIVYSGPKLYPAANKWKICCNENAKNLAWSNQYPEFNHNEFIGWTSHPVDKPFGVVEIRSNLEHERTQKRFKVTEKLLSGRRPAPIVVEPKGETHLQQLLWASMLGDFVTIYLALLNNQNPTPVDLVEKFKAELNQ
jgi:glucose/mannose-6-phosphate isomerase